MKLFEIFLDFDAPLILQHTNGNDDFLRGVVGNLKKIDSKLRLVWSSKKDEVFDLLVNDVHKLLTVWLRDNDTDNWLNGLKYVQDRKTCELNTVTHTSPFIMTFGKDKQRNMVSRLNACDQVWSKLENEDDLVEYLRSTANSNPVHLQTENLMDKPHQLDNCLSVLQKRKRVKSVIDMILTKKSKTNLV